MKDKLNYMLIGVILTMLVIGGALSIVLSPTDASSEIPSQPSVLFNKSDEEPVVIVTDDGTVLASEAPLDSSEPVVPPDSQLDSVSNDNYQIESEKYTPEQIVATVRELAEREEARLLTTPGWIHIRQVKTAPDERQDGDYGSSSGKSISVGELIPQSSPIFEEWYRVDEQAFFQEAMGLVLSADGAIHQHTVLVDGRWAHMTLRAQGFPQGEYTTGHVPTRVSLPLSQVASRLEELLKLESVMISGFQDNGRLVVLTTSDYPAPVTLGTPKLPAAVVGEVTTYTFDLEAGQLLSFETHFNLQDGSQYLMGRREHITVGFFTHLPWEMARLYNESAELIKREQ
jgi:hypothetical protein